MPPLLPRLASGVGQPHHEAPFGIRQSYFEPDGVASAFFAWEHPTPYVAMRHPPNNLTGPEVVGVARLTAYPVIDFMLVPAVAPREVVRHYMPATINRDGHNGIRIDVEIVINDDTAKTRNI